MISSGQTIAGKYRINQLLGSGGMASVWSATNIFTEREFAIKFMLPAVARTPEAARRFLMEAKVSARVDHPNIIEIIDVGQTEDSCLFLVMELLTGVSLETAIKRQTPPMTAPPSSPASDDPGRADARRGAAKSGVIHRDLKPTNIFLHKDREGAAVPKVLDFGVSKFLEEEGATSLTIAGTVLGSPLYMSPEQAMGAAIDLRTDVFAFGTILFEGFCGYRAYEAPNFNALIVKIATTQPKQIDACAPKLPDALRAVVRDCMMTDQETRLGTFEVVADRLAAALPELERSKLLGGLPLSHPPHRRASGRIPDARRTRSPSCTAGTSGRTSRDERSPAPHVHSERWWSALRQRSRERLLEADDAPSGHVAETTLSHPRRAYMAGAVVVGLAAAAGIIGVIRAASGAPHSLPSSRVDPTPVAAAADRPPAPRGASP